MITTTPGFSSRSTDAQITQLPQRDEEVMEEQVPGFSNSEPSEDANAAQKAHEAQTFVTSGVVEAGFSNSAPAGDDGASVTIQEVEDEAPAKKAAAKKTAAKKG